MQSIPKNRSPVNLKVTLRPEVSDWFCITIGIYFDYTASCYCRPEWKLKVVVILCFCLPCFTKASPPSLKSFPLISVAGRAVACTVKANGTTHGTVSSKSGYFIASLVQKYHTFSAVRWYLRSFNTSKQGLSFIPLPKVWKVIWLGFIEMDKGSWYRRKSWCMSEIPTGEQAIFWLCISQCSTAGPELSLAAPGLQCERETSWGSDCTVCSLKHRAALQDAEWADSPVLHSVNKERMFSLGQWG